MKPHPIHEFHDTVSHNIVEALEGVVGHSTASQSAKQLSTMPMPVVLVRLVHNITNDGRDLLPQRRQISSAWKPTSRRTQAPIHP